MNDTIKQPEDIKADVENNATVLDDSALNEVVGGVMLSYESTGPSDSGTVNFESPLEQSLVDVGIIEIV